MSRSNLILLILIAVLQASCIEFYHPDLGGKNTPKYVVEGLITDQEGYQTVTVSMTSPLEYTKYNPLSYCTVKIVDEEGNMFKMNEFMSNVGTYRVWIAKKYLNPGNSYQVQIVTASGVEIISDFDTMPECPIVDSVFYIRKDLPTTNTYQFIQGIQFYLNLDGRGTNSHFYRWNLVETWEHHALIPMDQSKRVCWTTQAVKYMFTLSTENLTQNEFKMYPLHFVDNRTPRLNYGYSLLINQYAISKPAFIYWNKLRINTNEQGGLYSGQPLQVSGNLTCTTDPEIKVLGFFSASSTRSKRVFVKKVPNLRLFEEFCEPDPKTHAYSVGCTECDYLNGTTVRPDFWPEYLK